MRGISTVSPTDQLSGYNWKLGSDSAPQPRVGLNLQLCYLAYLLCYCHLMFDWSQHKSSQVPVVSTLQTFCSNKQSPKLQSRREIINFLYFRSQKTPSPSEAKFLRASVAKPFMTFPCNVCCLELVSRILCYTTELVSNRSR